MKHIEFKDHQPGDVFVVRGYDLVADMIAFFEAQLHPDYKGSFFPTHAGIVGYNDMVIEATLHGLTTVNPIVSYDKRPIQLYRLKREEEETDRALADYLGLYGAAGYGWADLLGFALEAFQRHEGNLHAHNAILHGFVCSQGVLLYLRMHCAIEGWPARVEMDEAEPLSLMLTCDSHCI